MKLLANWLGRKGRGLKCAAVTPIGPGHVERARDCRTSIDAAWREHQGPFSELEFHFVDDGEGALGRSKARNRGAEAARQAGADWIFFLDADDLMTPRAFSIFERYADNFDAVWGLMAIKPPDESARHIRFPQALTLQSVDELLLLDPFLTLLMGHFVRTSMAVALPFDESMDAGEDFDYYIRAWKQYRCTKIAEVLSVNRSDQHSSGPRAASADQWRTAATARLADGRTKRGLGRYSSRAIAAVNRCSLEAQAFSRARDEAGTGDVGLFASRLPYRGFVDVAGCAGGDFVLFSNNDDPISLSIAWTGEYMPASSRLWQALARDATWILDVGASTGYFTLLAARAAPAADIICFEPLTRNFSRLQLNLALNDVRNVRALDADKINVDAEITLRAASDRVAPGLIRIGAETSAADITAVIQHVQRELPELLISIKGGPVAEHLDQELRASGYHFYKVDENSDAITASEKLTCAAGASENVWATMRLAADAAGIINNAYGSFGRVAGC